MHALHDGDAIEPWETVLTIAGDYTLFAHLETVYLGALARRTLVSTNVRRVVEAAAPKPILFFPARHDHWLVQTGDGYAAHVAGAIGVSTDAQSSWWGGARHRHRASRVDRVLRRRHGRGCAAVRGVGAGRHERRRARGLRQRLGADGSRGGARARAETVGREARHVRAPRRPLALGRAGRLRPARRQRAARSQGACALDAEGFGAVRIVVSGGFTVERSARSRPTGVPVDVYGVGSSLLRGSNDFTADIVRVEGRPLREGRPRGASEPSARSRRDNRRSKTSVCIVDRGRDRIRRRDGRPDQALREPHGRQGRRPARPARRRVRLPRPERRRQDDADPDAARADARRRRHDAPARAADAAASRGSAVRASVRSSRSRASTAI